MRGGWVVTGLLSACAPGSDTADSGDPLAALRDALSGSDGADTSDSLEVVEPGEPEELPLWMSWIREGELVIELYTERGALGIAETGCGSPENCWYGEDCVYGDLSGSYRLCHPLQSGTNTLLQVGSLEELVEGKTTLFSAVFEPYVTFYFEDFSGACRVWGHEVSYYDGLGCVEL